MRKKKKHKNFGLMINSKEMFRDMKSLMGEVGVEWEGKIGLREN